MDEPGRLIRELLSAKGLRPRDIERESRSIADRKGDTRFHISHASLASIEAGSIPSIYKIFSLAHCCGVPYDHLLKLYGVEVNSASSSPPSPLPAKETVDSAGLAGANFRFTMNFDARTQPLETNLLPRDLKEWGALPQNLVSRIEPRRFLYAIIGMNDEALPDIVPPGSLVEIDTQQKEIAHCGWQTRRERPIYIIWHDGGYSCGWCQVKPNELLLVPDPISRQPILQFRIPAQATVIGRVVHVWYSLSSDLPSRANPPGRSAVSRF